MMFTRVCLRDVWVGFRFAAFVSGGQHILDEEMSDYENDPAPVTESEIEDNLKDSSEEECL